jgi:hypothetical protein
MVFLMSLQAINITVSMIILKKLLTDKKIELFNVIDTYIMDFRTIQAYT